MSLFLMVVGKDLATKLGGAMKELAIDARTLFVIDARTLFCFSRQLADVRSGRLYPFAASFNASREKKA